MGNIKSQDWSEEQKEAVVKYIMDRCRNEEKSLRVISEYVMSKMNDQEYSETLLFADDYRPQS